MREVTPHVRHPLATMKSIAVDQPPTLWFIILEPHRKETKAIMELPVQNEVPQQQYFSPRWVSALDMLKNCREMSWSCYALAQRIWKYKANLLKP